MGRNLRTSRCDVGLPVSIGVRGGALAGTLHLPSGRAPRRGRPAVLLCHGLTGTRVEAHYIFVKTSGVLGLSLGGTVVALLAGALAGKGRAPRGVVLWNAVADLAGVWEPRLAELRCRSRGRLRFPIEHRGHRIGRGFFRDMRAVPGAPEALASSGAPALVVGAAAEAEHARAYARACGGRRARQVVLKGCDHTFARTDREKKVICITTHWFGRHLRAPGSG
jgi:hypothetical protein